MGVSLSMKPLKKMRRAWRSRDVPRARLCWGWGHTASTGGTDPARSSSQRRSTKTPARGADPSSLPTPGFRVINSGDPMCRCWEGRPVPPRAASSLFAYSNPQPFEQIIKIHLYLICLLELIEFLRLANVSGCTLPPNGDPAAGAAGAAPQPSPLSGDKSHPGAGHRVPTGPAGKGRGMPGCQHPPSSAAMLSDTRRASPKPSCGGRLPQIPRDSRCGGFAGDTGSPSLPFPHPCWRCQCPAWHCGRPPGEESLPPLPILLLLLANCQSI